MTEHSKAWSFSWLPHVVAGACLLFALNRSNPYSYYIVLRFVCCPVFAYLAFELGRLEKISWAWILGSQAVLYNPLFRVHLNREIWSFLNLTSCVILAIAYVVLRVARARLERMRRSDESSQGQRQRLL